MAFPAAHFSFGCGVATALGRRIDSLKTAAFWMLISILPDFDFFFVSVLGWNLREYHRTFTHSFIFTLAASLAAFAVGIRAGWMRSVIDWLAAYLVLLSHLLLDFFCVASIPQHGAMLLWPFTAAPLGFESFLVPLYRSVAGDSTSLLRVAIPYTLLELVLWSPVTVWVIYKQKNARNL